MTHFTVLVVGDDVEEILEPYNENNPVAPYVDKTAEEVEAEFQRRRERVHRKYASGETLDEFDSMTYDLEHVTSDWWKQWTGHPLNHKGESTSTYNPNSKWDWYQIGGRWYGMLVLKPGISPKRGEPSFMMKLPEEGIPGNRADVARICDVDWKAMHKMAQDRAAKDWDTLFEPYNEKTCMWRPEYVESQKELHLRLYGTKEEYVRRRGFWTPYAMVSRENGWLAPGDMGWWGLSSDKTEDREKFDGDFVKIMKSFPPETTITLVDCHI